MCRVEERIYIKADGQRQKFEDSFPCHNSKHGKLCSNVKRKTTEYYPKLKPIIRDSRDGTTSPASYDPPTPDGTGSYLVQQRRPSAVERRPSTREGPRAVRPEIIIEFGSKKDKDRSKKYPAISVKSYKRSSLGAISTNSNDFVVESPSSDASFTVRTGLTDTPVLLSNPYQQSPSGYTTRPAVPHSHHRHTSSTSSFTTSSQPPSLYATSETESPTGRRAPRYPPTIVHNPPQFTSSPTQTRATPVTPSSATLHINFGAPQDTTPRQNIGSDNLFPLDYSEFHDRSAPSSHTSSGHVSSGRAAAPEITDRANERDRLRRLNKENERRRQEEEDRLLAQQIAQDEAQTRAKEEEKQVRFEIDRYKDRENQRTEARLAESERRRAEEWQETRLRKQREQDERDAIAAKEEKRAKADRLAADIARREKAIRDAEAKLTGRESRPRDSRPPTRDMSTTTRHRSRRPSISRAQAQERDLLLAETEAQMAREREVTEQREREESAALLRQQQQTSQYWDPRGGARNPITVENPGLGGRRGSVSGRRPSISSSGPPPSMSIGRTNSQRRASIVHQAPPASLPQINTSFANQYSTRPPSAHRNQTTPLFSPAGSSQTYIGSRPPSVRHASYNDNPFAAPPTRTSQENPFTPAPGVVQQVHTMDPWDTRNLREALPQAQIRQPASTLGVEQPHTLKRRGEDVISRAAEDRSSRARQATRSMRKATGFEDDYESEENGADKTTGYAQRRKEKKKH